MAKQNVLYEKRGAVAYVTLNRPEVHNCIDVEMSNELIAVWEELKRDHDVRRRVHRRREQQGSARA